MKDECHFKYSYQPPGRVRVNPNLAFRSTDTLMPIIPRPCEVKTCPLITETRLKPDTKKSIPLM